MNTDYNKNNNKIPIKVLIIIYIGIIIILTMFKLLNLITFIISSVILLCLIYVNSGYTSAKKIIEKENKYIEKTNPYIYFRELPNNYGIGVATLLMDSTIENYKDIVAVFLDLCARRYLKLNKQGDKYVIKVLKGIDNKLLSNEKYILSLILCDDIKNINYNEWFDYCMKDGIDLGLYTHKIQESKMENPYKTRNKRMKMDIVIKLIISLIISGLLYYVSYNDDIIVAIFTSIFFFFISYFVLTLIFNIKGFFRETFKMAGYQRHLKYIEGLNTILTRTDKGIDELQKLYSFKSFIKDFGRFVDKNPEEVILWDRYLSYAQVFGLTKEIMKSGYEQLVSNSSFDIDSINNITMNNIRVEK